MLLVACVVQAAVSIIVTDYPPTSSTEYNYSYNVINPSTGDAKTLHEMRRGGIVTGSYSLIDPDGTRRTVKYTAGPRTGFNAVVHQEPANPISYNPHSTGYPSLIGRLPPVPYVHKLPNTTYLPAAKKTNREYFTPGNQMTSDKPVLNNGQYFAANNAYHTNRI